MVCFVKKLPTTFSPGVFSKVSRAFLSKGCSYCVWVNPDIIVLLRCIIDYSHLSLPEFPTGGDYT